MLKRWRSFVEKRKLTNKKILIFAGLILLGAVLIFQVFYPGDRMLPFSSVKKLNYSSWLKTDVVKSLDDNYSNKEIGIFFNDNKFDNPLASNIGISTDNSSLISKDLYPWYLRIIPTSILWASSVNSYNDKPVYKYDQAILDKYIKEKIGSSCNVEPKNASLEVKDGKIVLVPEVDGAKCDIEVVKQKLASIEPEIQAESKVEIVADITKPSVQDAAALSLSKSITESIGDSVSMVVGNETKSIPSSELIKWLTFGVDGEKLTYSFDSEKAKKYLNDNFASKVAIPAGTTTVATYDFVELSRDTGASGQVLNITGTLSNIKSFIEGEVAKPSVAVSSVAPKVVYNRSYSSSNTGMMALIQNYADTHAGTYAVNITELGGSYRHASYNGGRSFVAASTFKLYVAYSTLLRIESGEWQWTDQTNGGRDLAKCFDDMLVVSDNDCAHAMLTRIGFTNITNEARAIGSSNTSFLGDNIVTTADDLNVLLVSLYNGQILSKQSSRDLLINTMKRNIYRQGIPKGTGLVVADKVGFLWGLLHDAAIVYSPTGNYVLTIMTDGASWSNIAELSGQLENLRNQ